MPLTPRDPPSSLNKTSKDANKLKGINEALKNEQQQQQENSSISFNKRPNNDNNKITSPSPPKTIKSSSLSTNLQSSPRRMSCIGIQVPRRGSVYGKSQEEIEFERLQFSSGLAQQVLDTTKDSLKKFEEEVWKNENKRGKNEISNDKLIKEIEEIDKLILNLQPAYQAVCQSLDEKLKLKQKYENALKNANSKTNMLLDFQKIEAEAALQADMELLKRAALLMKGKQPKERKTKGNGDRRAKNLRISKQVEKRKEGFKELPNIQDIAKLAALASNNG